MNYIPERALVIFAHPDDIEFVCAGTTALWAKRGAQVRYIVITDGNSGSHDPNMTKERIAEIRRAEQTEAARIAGCEVTFLGYADGVLQPTLELRRDLVREIRRMKPNVIITGNPSTYFVGNEYVNHPDHRAAATATIDACYPAPNSPLIFPELVEEGFEPCDVNFVYVRARPENEPNLWIDISSTLETKIEALKAHESQLKEWDPTESITNWAKETGSKVGLAYAEAYRRITLKPLEDELGEEV